MAEVIDAMANETVKEKYKVRNPSLAEMKVDATAITKKLDNAMVNEWMKEDEVVEQLELGEDFSIMLTVHVHTDARGTPENVEIKTGMDVELVFESLVTGPDELDWRILALDQDEHGLDSSELA